MGYKCRICGVNEVDNQGDVCELCAIGQDPYAQGQEPFHGVQIASQSDKNGSQGSGSYLPKRGANRKVLLNGGASLADRDPYGNDMSPSTPQTPVQVYSAGQVPQSSQVSDNSPPVAKPSGKEPLAAGITKNIASDSQKNSVLTKWFRALFTGIPFTLDDDVTTFQVFPDYTGTTLNALGNACDQVVVYGKLNIGAVSENNDVEVYGRRDAKNNIVARKIINKASGTEVTPMRTVGQGLAWLITLFAVALLVAIIVLLGVEGVIWAAVIILCLTNLPKVLKILGAVFGALFSLVKRIFK